MKKNKTVWLSYLEGWASIVLNILLFIIKYWAGISTGSLAIIADAWHTLSDSFTSLVVILGARASVIPPDKKHPFGHGRSELIASLIISVILAVVALDFTIEAFSRISGMESTKYGKLAIIATLASVISKEMMAWFAFWAAKKADSPSLRADAWHHRSDAFSSLILLLGIVWGGSFWWMDSAMALVVAGMLFYASFSIFKETIDPLIGEAPDEEFIQKIRELILEVTGKELSPHHFHIHRYGGHTELIFHSMFPIDISLVEAHDIATSIENKIFKEFEIYTTIHMEPHE